jgi:hypothetical protein
MSFPSPTSSCERLISRPPPCGPHWSGIHPRSTSITYVWAPKVSSTPTNRTRPRAMNRADPFDRSGYSGEEVSVTWKYKIRTPSLSLCPLLHLSPLQPRQAQTEMGAPASPVPVRGHCPEARATLGCFAVLLGGRSMPEKEVTTIVAAGILHRRHPSRRSAARAVDRLYGRHSTSKNPTIQFAFV